MTDYGRLGTVRTVGLTAILVLGTVLALANPLWLLAYLAYVSVGAVLVVRRPRIVIGWLLIGIAFAPVGTVGASRVDTVALAAGTASLGEELTAWVGSWSGSSLFVAFFALMVVFPSGRLPGGRWLVPSRLLLLYGGAIVLLAAISPTIDFAPTSGGETIQVPNPFAVLPTSPLWTMVPTWLPFASLVGLLLGGVGSIGVRYRRSTGILRLQLRWLVASVTFVVAAIVAGLAAFAVVADDIVWIPVVVAFPTIPIAVGVAVLRYRLLEIDRIVSRTVGYALLTGVLAVVFAGSILVLETALATVAQVQTIAVAASTLAVFALFQPLHRRVQRLVDRRFDRARYDAERIAQTFATRLRSDVDLASVRSEILWTATSAVRPTTAGLWLREERPS